jgi:hypothetical protein
MVDFSFVIGILTFVISIHGRLFLCNWYSVESSNEITFFFFFLHIGALPFFSVYLLRILVFSLQRWDKYLSYDYTLGKTEACFFFFYDEQNSLSTHVRSFIHRFEMTLLGTGITTNLGSF